VPPSLDACHCSVGGWQFGGVEAAAVTVADSPTVMVRLVGCSVIEGAWVQTGGGEASLSTRFTDGPSPPTSALAYQVPAAVQVVGPTHDTPEK